MSRSVVSWRSRAMLAVSIAAVAAFAPAAPMSSAAMISVDIVDAPRPQPKWGFAPAKRQIDAGTWITWSNSGQDAHTVTAVDGSFDSGDIDPSDGFSWYFADAGTYTYVCALHPWMTGTITVGDGGTAAVDLTPPDQSSGDVSLTAPG